MEHSMIKTFQTTTSRRALLAGARAVAAASLAGGVAANVVAIAITRAVEADPVFAFIAEHRNALEVYIEACEEDFTDEYADECGDGEMAALEALLTCPPRTREGAVALLEHLSRPSPDGDQTTILAYALNWRQGSAIYEAACVLPRLIAEEVVR
jgi:hypothetical protein